MSDRSALLLAQFESATEAREAQEHQEHQRQRQQLLERLEQRKNARVGRAAGAKSRDAVRRGSMQSHSLQLSEVQKAHQTELETLPLKVRMKRGCEIVQRQPALVAQLAEALLLIDGVASHSVAELYKAEAASVLLQTQECLSRQGLDLVRSREQESIALRRRLAARRQSKTECTAEEQTSLTLFADKWSSISTSGGTDEQIVSAQLAVIALTLSGGCEDTSELDLQAECAAILVELSAAAAMLQGQDEMLRERQEDILRQRLAARRRQPQDAGTVSEHEAVLEQLVAGSVDALVQELVREVQMTEQQQADAVQRHGLELAVLCTSRGEQMVNQHDAQIVAAQGVAGDAEHELQLLTQQVNESAAAHTSTFGTTTTELASQLLHKENSLLARLNASNDELITQIEARANRIQVGGKDKTIGYLQKQLKKSECARNEDKSKRKAAKHAERERRQAEEDERLDARAAAAKEKRANKGRKAQALIDAREYASSTEAKGVGDTFDNLSHLSMEQLATMPDDTLAAELAMASQKSVAVKKFSNMLRRKSSSTVPPYSDVVSYVTRNSSSSRLAPLSRSASDGMAESTNEAAKQKQKAVKYKALAVGLRQELHCAAEREKELGDAYSYMEQRCLEMEEESRVQEEELLLWRMQFAELQAAGVLTGVAKGAHSIWDKLLELKATPTDD